MDVPTWQTKALTEYGCITVSGIRMSLGRRLGKVEPCVVGVADHLSIAARLKRQSVSWTDLGGMGRKSRSFPS